MGLLFYHLILVIYFFNVESSSTVNQSTADRKEGIVCVIENIVSGIYETLLRLTKTSNNVSFPLTTVPDTHGLYHHIATSHPQEENETWRKFIVWEVVFQEAIKELKVDEDDEMIQCVTLVNEQLFRGRPRQDSMVRVLKLVCADHGIPDRTMSPKSKQNYFSSMNRYAFAHTYRMKFYENRSEEFTMRTTDHGTSNNTRYVEPTLQDLQQFDVNHNRWYEIYWNILAVGWYDYSLNSVNVSSKNGVYDGISRIPHLPPEYTRNLIDKKYHFFVHTNAPQNCCLFFYQSKSDITHSRNYLGYQTVPHHLVTILLFLFYVYIEALNSQRHFSNDRDDYKQCCVCNTTKVSFPSTIGYPGACPSTSTQKVFNVSLEYNNWLEDQAFHSYESFLWWSLICILIIALVLQFVYTTVMHLPSTSPVLEAHVTDGKRKGVIQEVVKFDTFLSERRTFSLTANTHNMSSEKITLTVTCTRCSKRKIPFAEKKIIRPKYSRIDSTDLRRPKSRISRLFARKEEKHIDITIIVNKRCEIFSIQQESKNFQSEHSDKMLTSSNRDMNSIFKNGFNNYTHTGMGFTTNYECPPCTKMVLQDLPISDEVENTNTERETSSACNGHENIACFLHHDNCTENENKQESMSRLKYPLSNVPNTVRSMRFSSDHSSTTPPDEVNGEAKCTSEKDDSSVENGSQLKNRTIQYNRDQPDEEQTTLKSAAGDIHPCSDNYENSFDTQEVSCPVDLGISSRQNSYAIENTEEEIDFSILRDIFSSRDELSSPPGFEDHGLLQNEVLNDEMQFPSGSNNSLLHSDISKTLTSFDGKTSLDDYTGDTSFGDFLENSDLNNIEVYGCSFSTQRDVTSAKNAGRRIRSPLLEIDGGKNEIANEKYQLKKPPLALYSLIKEKVEKYFNLRLRRIASQKKRKVMRRIKKLCLQWRKSEKFYRRENITCHPFLDPGNTEDSTPPQAIAPIHPTDEESLQSHTPPESVGSLSSLFNDISFQSAHDDEIYRFEWFRLASFRHFDSGSVHAIILARNGWYGTENGNETVCYSCHRVRESWESGDDPRAFHDTNCRFLNEEINNVPIPRDYPQNMIHTDHSRPTTIRNTFHGDRQQLTIPEDSVPTDEREALSTLSNELSSFSSNSTSVYRVEYGRQDWSDRRRDNNQRTEMIENMSPSERGYQSDVSTATQPVTTRNGTAHCPLEAPSEGESQRQTQVQTSEASASSSNREAQLEALRRDPMGINFERPKYPSYAILAVRISSYTDWPAAMTQTPRDMALAGFFYAGCGDYTRCFFCGGGLRNWEAGDDPWVEHARWFSKCAFVRQNRGQQFIDLVLHRMREIEQQQTEPQVTDPTDDKASKEERIMKSAAVKSIQDMGYSEEIIKTAISTIKSRLPKGKHKVSAHEILEVVFELVDRERARSSSESSLNRRSEGESVTESLFNNANVSRESHEISPPQQGGVGENETASRRTDSLTLNEVESLQRENTSLKDQILCKICMEKNVSIAFLPCGHLACCVDCAPAMRKCPICREFVRGTVKTFLV